MTKIVSVTASGRVRKTSAYKVSTSARIKQLLRELGLDETEYQFKASLRKYNRMASNPHIGLA
jgi:hypothetical protein